jgi:pyridoxal kinase
MTRVLILSSHVAASRVGGRVAVSAMEARGIDTVFCPTVLLGRHPGHGAPGGGAVPPEQFGSMLEGVAAQGLFAQFDAVLTGYFASAEQVEIAAAAIGEIRKASPHPLIVVDPIIGDHGALYVAEDVAIAIRDQLLPLANIITPNAFELGWLSGESVTDLGSARNAALHLGRPALISSIPDGDNLAVLYAHDGENWIRKHKIIEDVPNGTGDLLAAEFLASRLVQNSNEAALDRAIHRTFDTILKTKGWRLSELADLQGRQNGLHPNLRIEGGELARRGIGDGPLWVLGLDGCKAGWIGVWYDIHGHASPRHQLFSSLSEVADAEISPEIIAIDMPVGFPELSEHGGRICEREARALLGRKSSSVFSSPSRKALAANTYQEACELNSLEGGPRLSKQSYMLFPKMREVDALKKSEMGSIVFETHPEVALAIFERAPILEAKKAVEGRAARLTALRKLGFPIGLIDPHTYPNSKVAPDDLVDAAICAVTAQRIANGQHVTLPTHPPVDSDGIEMAIHA